MSFVCRWLQIQHQMVSIGVITTPRFYTGFTPSVDIMHVIISEGDQSCCERSKGVPAAEAHMPECNNCPGS